MQDFYLFSLIIFLYTVCRKYENVFQDTINTLFGKSDIFITTKHITCTLFDLLWSFVFSTCTRF